MNQRRFWLLIFLAAAVCLGTWLARGALFAQEKAVPAVPARAWEYQILGQIEVSRLGIPGLKLEAGVVRLDALRKGLDKLGAEGWELAAVECSPNYPFYYLKRPRSTK